MLYHPNKDKIGKSVENVIVKSYIQDLKSGIKHDTYVVEYDYNGSIKYAACYTDENGRFILVVSADDDDVLRDSASLIVKVTAISLLIGMAAIVVVFIFIRKIVAPLSYATNAVEELAALDFRVKNERQERRFAGLKDEVGNIMRAVLKLRGELTAVVTELKNQSGNLFEQSDSLSKSASDTMNNMKDTDRAVDEMANGATMLAQETQSASENVIEIGNMIDKVNDNTEELAKDADNMKELGENAENILRQLIAGQKEMVTHIGVVNDKTHEANKAAGKISEVVNLITEIESQTNLLSLNAHFILKDKAAKLVTDKKDSREMFWNGDVPFNMDGPWFVGMCKERDESLMDDIGIIPQFDVVYDGTTYKPNPTNYPLVTMISKNCKHPKEAYAFLEWMTTDEAQKIIADCGMIPSNTDYSTSDEYIQNHELEHKIVEFMQNNYTDLVADPNISQLGEISQIMLDAAQKMFSEQAADVQEEMDSAQKQVEEVMSRDAE